MNDELIVRNEKRLSRLILNRPPANGYHKDYLSRILEAIQEADQNETVKLVVMESASDKFFCGGADVKIFSENSTGQNKEMVVMARKVTEAITSSKKIFVAVIRGHTLGGGLELAMACDIRLASEGAYKIGLPEVKLGLMPGNGGTPRLIDLIGSSRAMELLVTGNSISPKRAYDIGLFNQLYAEGSFQDEVESYLDELSKGPGEAMAAIKNYVKNHKGMSLSESLEFETKSVNDLYDTPDAREGLLAFTEKRTAKFK